MVVGCQLLGVHVADLSYFFTTQTFIDYFLDKIWNHVVLFFQFVAEFLDCVHFLGVPVGKGAVDDWVRRAGIGFTY